jgi:hypothetical protein
MKTYDELKKSFDPTPDGDLEADSGDAPQGGLLLVSYDLFEKSPTAYSAIKKYFEEEKQAKPVLESAWIMRCSSKPSDIRNELRSSGLIKKDDRLVVSRLGGWASWRSKTDIKGF